MHPINDTKEILEIAAHDLQAPLRKLSVLTDRLVGKYADTANEEVLSYVKRINTCVYDMRSMIEGLSELAGAASNAMHYETCDLSQLLRNIIKELDEQCPGREIKIVGSLPVIAGDRLQLRQLFKKMLENAICFSDKKKNLQVEVRSPSVSEEEKRSFNLPVEEGFCKIEIADNGIGFSAESSAKIFQPFVRLNGKSAFPGNGLGLAVCEKIVANHQGKLYADGEENVGATFTVILPEKKQQA